MGHSSYSDEAARHIYTARASMTPDEVFTSKHSVDKALDPKDVKLRESRDSDAHPESNAISIFFDVTGSMGGIPKMFAMEKMPGLMRLLLSKGYIQHPQVLFGAVGDAKCDKSPLQVGQFESGMEMDDCLTKIHIEGGGGGQTHESYELAVYFAARHFACDCWEKRQKKPYLFTIGDEEPYASVSRSEVSDIIGDVIESDIPLKGLIEEVQTRFEYFHIAVSSHSYRDGHHKAWQKYLNERALFLERPEGVCELIGLTIGACEGRDLDDAGADLVAAGLDKHSVDAAKKAIIPYAALTGGGLTKAVVEGSLAPVTGAAHKSTRL
jgi:hypothetical protein